MRIHLFILLIITFFAGVVKGADPSFAIKLNNPAAVEYCTDPVLVAKNLTIEGNPNIAGMKISFSGGYLAGEDELVYSGSLTKNWSSSSGTLTLTGSANVQDYVTAITTITYKNNKSSPTLGVRKITISLSDVDYLPATGHFYRYVSKTGISWKDADKEAKSDAMMYYGLRGYLATITSQVENAFIQSKTQGVGWIGATDEAGEGVWRWVTGPEASEDVSGRLFWNSAGSYLGRYNNWNNGEPNDCCEAKAHEEDYAHILYFRNDPASSLKWNDLPVGGGAGEYAAQGYLIEFGGMENVILELSATLDLQVNTMNFKNEPIPAFCEGSNVTLNQPDPTPATYIWTPAESLSSASIANPVASPKLTTTYSVTGTRGTCRNTADYVVTVNPKPVSLLKTVENICKGQTITLDPGLHENYSWNNGATTRTISVDVAGEYTVILTDNDCQGTFSTNVVIHNIPTINLTRLDTLICGKKSDILDISKDKGLLTVERLSDNYTFSNLEVNVPDFGTYQFKIKAIDEFSCYSDTVVSIGFRKTPTVNFSVDSTKCYGYNLDVKYLGDAGAASDFVWIFGGDTIKRGVGANAYLVPLGINRATRDLKIIVTDQGCPNDKTLYDIKVIPNLQMVVLESEGCEPFTAKFTADNTEKVTYNWDFGDGNMLSGPTSNPSNTYQNDGYYAVSLKVTTNKGCSNEVRIDSMVHVAPIPTSAFTTLVDCLEKGNHEISYNGTDIQLDTYVWDLSMFDNDEIIRNPGTTQGPFIFNLKNKPQANIGLKVISKYGCQSNEARRLVKRKPDFSINTSSNGGCAPFEPLFGAITNDLVDKLNYSWDFGDGTIGLGEQVSHEYMESDKKYDVVLTALSSTTGCADTLISEEFVQVFPKPKAAFSMDNNIVYNDKPDVKFTDNSEGASTYLWDFGAGVTSDLQNPSYHFVKMGHQVVLLQVANTHLCTDTVSHSVLVAFDHLFPPNGFSPNAPNEVDREFKLNSEGLSPEGYHFTVLSRWNDLVFEVKDEIKGWDGRTKNGTFAPAGAYVWILNFNDFLGRRHRQTGTVTLIY